MGLLNLSLAPRARSRSDADEPLRTTAKELEPDAFMRWLESSVTGETGLRSAFALLVINLRRSDRAAALMGRPWARAGGIEALRRISAALRPQDRFARLGPEHLIVALPKITEVDVVTLAVNRLFTAFERPIDAGGERIRMRPCAGCALSLPDEATDTEALLDAADAACVEAQSTEERFAYALATSRRSRETEGMLDEFQAALQNNELEVWFQPQCHLGSGACRAVEALLRWHNRHRNCMVIPTQAVELAENYGMMPALTKSVLNTSLRQVSELRRGGIDVRVAVNISASSLRDVELPELIARSLATWGVPSDRLTIEVTESAIMLDVERSLQVMQELKQQGIRLSVDDFGTGYSSLAYLRRMPLDELKIDKAFVQNMLENKGDVQIVRSVIDLAHNFELEAVAEGVESLAALEMLARLGCDVIQGFHYARPMPFAELPAWWASHSPASPAG